MIKLVRKYKTVLLFILTFLGTYLLLTALYSGYLSVAASDEYYPDYITHQVARQSEAIIEFIGYNAQIEPHQEEASMKLFIEGEFLARIVEGCNAISVIILFCAFVLAFWNGFKKTMLFLLFGILSVYLVNLIRIAILAIALYEYPQWREFLHDIVFPGLIYGYVFMLWFLWVTRFRSEES